MTRTITIEPVLNGFVCQVGCQRVVFNGISDMLLQLGRYYADPHAMEKEFISKALNKTMDNVAPVCNQVPEPLGLRDIARREAEACDNSIREMRDAQRRANQYPVPPPTCGPG